MNNILLHIPHSGKIIPSFFWKNICLDRKKLENFINDITDTDTDKLFSNNKHKKVIFKINRVVCDPEKFLDDSQEVMSKFGMGAIYTKTNLGETFLKPSEKYKQKIIKKYYIPFHEKLDKIALNMLKKGEKVIMIDCHSFSEEIIMHKEKKLDLPDICVGYNEEFNPLLIQTVVDFFNNLGYKVKENYPYEGAMLPDKLFSCPNGNFYSVMIEINKELYKNNSSIFIKLQKELNILFANLERLELN